MQPNKPYTSAPYPKVSFTTILGARCDYCRAHWDILSRCCLQCGAPMQAQRSTKIAMNPGDGEKFARILAEAFPLAPNQPVRYLYR